MGHQSIVPTQNKFTTTNFGALLTREGRRGGASSLFCGRRSGAGVRHALTHTSMPRFYCPLYFCRALELSFGRGAAVMRKEGPHPLSPNISGRTAACVIACSCFFFWKRCPMGTSPQSCTNPLLEKNGSIRLQQSQALVL